MAFFKFRSGGQQGNEGRNVPASNSPAESVEAMRRRARHRLLGAAVLVLVGVIGFPLLFDTQPRPIASDIPIEIPDRAKAKPLSVPTTPAPSATPKSADGDRRVAQASPAADEAMITENADGSEVTAPAKPQTSAKPESKPEPKADAKPEQKPEAKPEVKAEAKPERKPEPKPDPKAEAKSKPSAGDDGARARALLDGAATPVASTKPAAAAPSDAAGRFVVQVGAFADAAKASEVRQKLEKAGLKTYTNVAKTADGERTRVRVGPFSSRADADKAAGKIKDLALPAAVLSL